MSRQLFLSISLVSLAVLVAAGCASPTNNNPTGTAGTMGTGGNGGSGNTGGTSPPPPPGLASGGPFPFPQSKKSGSCSIATAANAGPAALTAYNNWKSTFVTATGAGGFLRVQSPQHSGGT